MNTGRYITYIIQKALQIHERDEQRGLALYYLGTPQRMCEIDAVDSLMGDAWSKEPRFPLPDPQTLANHAEHFGIHIASTTKEGELLLFSKEGRTYYALFSILRADESMSLQKSMKSLLEDHINYGDNFISINQDPDV